MGVTAIVGVSCAIGGALIGGGGVAYYHHKKKQKEQKELEEYLEKLKDLGLDGRKVTAVLITSNYH